MWYVFSFAFILKGKWLRALCNVSVMFRLEKIVQLHGFWYPTAVVQGHGIHANTNSQTSLPRCQTSLPQLAAVRPAETLQTFIHIINKFSWRHNSAPRVAVGFPWGTSDYIYLQRATQCFRRKPWALALFRMQTCLNFCLAALNTSPALGFLK